MVTFKTLCRTFVLLVLSVLINTPKFVSAQACLNCDEDGIEKVVSLAYGKNVLGSGVARLINGKMIVYDVFDEAKGEQRNLIYYLNKENRCYRYVVQLNNDSYGSLMKKFSEDPGLHKMGENSFLQFDLYKDERVLWTISQNPDTDGVELIAENYHVGRRKKF